MTKTQKRTKTQIKPIKDIFEGRDEPDYEYQAFCDCRAISARNKAICMACGGKGYIFEGPGKSVHTCWSCMGGTK